MKSIMSIYLHFTKCRHDKETRNCPTCNNRTCIDCYILYHSWVGDSCAMKHKVDVDWINYCMDKGHSKQCPHIINPAKMKLYEKIQENLMKNE